MTRIALARQAFLRACALDVEVRKPGNVSFASPGHGMRAEQFLSAAAAAAGPIGEPGASVGERIEGAVRAAWAASGCNTNLGIVLLCAPLLAAFERCEHDDALRPTLETVLARLDLEDARAAFRAIALARPGGLGRVPRQDVSAPPTVNLREAMGLAAQRDRIAWQYVHGFADVFELGLPAFVAAGADERQAMRSAFLAFAATHPDSHIVRKNGDALAQSVMREAARWRARVQAGGDPDADPAFARWDEDLKARGLNPGTGADLAVAAALVALLNAALKRFP